MTFRGNARNFSIQTRSRTTTLVLVRREYNVLLLVVAESGDRREHDSVSMASASTIACSGQTVPVQVTVRNLVVLP